MTMAPRNILRAAVLLGLGVATGCAGMAGPPRALGEAPKAISAFSAEPLTVSQNRYSLESLQAAEQQAKDIAFTFHTNPASLMKMVRLDVDFDAHNKSKVDRCDVVFTYFIPLGTRFVPGSLHLEGLEGKESAVEILADRLVVRNPLVEQGHSLHGGLSLQVLDGAKAGDLIKNVFTYQDCLTGTPLPRKVEEWLGKKPGNVVHLATLPTLVIRHSVATAGGGTEAQIPEPLEHGLSVANTGDVPADETRAELPVPSVATYQAGSLLVSADAGLLAGTPDSGLPQGAPDSLTVDLGNLRGTALCSWRTRVNRGTADLSPIAGTARVTSAPWAIDAAADMRIADGRTAIVVAPVLGAELALAPAPTLADPGRPARGSGAFTLTAIVANTGHAAASGTFVTPTFPGPGFDVVPAWPAFGPGYLATVPVGGTAEFRSAYRIPAEFDGKPLSVGIIWESLQTFPSTPKVIDTGSLDAFLTFEDGPVILVR